MYFLPRKVVKSYGGSNNKLTDSKIIYQKSHGIV